MRAALLCPVTHGWSATRTNQAANRNLLPQPEANTLVDMAVGTQRASWSYHVSNDNYPVIVVVGEAERWTARADASPWSSGLLSALVKPRPAMDRGQYKAGLEPDLPSLHRNHVPVRAGAAYRTACGIGRPVPTALTPATVP